MSGFLVQNLAELVTRSHCYNIAGNRAADSIFSDQTVLDIWATLSTFLAVSFVSEFK